MNFVRNCYRFRAWKRSSVRPHPSQCPSAAAVFAERSWLHRTASRHGALAGRDRASVHDAYRRHPATKFDPRISIAIGFALTSFGLFHVTNIYLGVSFSTVVSYRIIQVIGIPLIFIPISTLNYVGVPQNKFNQVSGVSNFICNIGGAICVSLSNNFITRQGQVHRTVLAALTNHANPFFERQLNAMTQNFIFMGASAMEASHRALAQLSAQVDLQANVLGFVNSFGMLGLLVMFLIPLPFVMRRPSPEEAKAAAATH